MNFHHLRTFRSQKWSVFLMLSRFEYYRFNAVVASAIFLRLLVVPSILLKPKKHRRISKQFTLCWTQLVLAIDSLFVEPWRKSWHSCRTGLLNRRWNCLCHRGDCCGFAGTEWWFKCAVRMLPIVQLLLIFNLGERMCIDVAWISIRNQTDILKINTNSPSPQ